MLSLPSLITLFALTLYFVLTINVGRARAKYKVPVPQMSGNPDFERVVDFSII
jgi:glutathione S-transferase